MTDTPRSAADQVTAAPEAGVGRDPAYAQIGPYRLLQRIGEGGMGEVWLAEQVVPLRRQVAVKIVKAGMDTAQVLARFAAERQALALMDHPAIARIYDGGTTPQGRPYFAMEYVRGEALTRYCDKNRLSIPARLELFIHLCDGVQHAHQKGIIHRDLKPSNVLVSDQGEQPVPHIIDFGIAKAVSQPLTDQPVVTMLGGFIGTPDYMSPEQAEMTSLDVDTRSDVYSLGVILYELLTGALPFDTERLREAGVDALRRAIREQEPPRPSTRVTTNVAQSTEAAERRSTPPLKLVSQLRGDLDWIVLRALAKDRNRRYQTVNALGLDIKRHLHDEPVLAGPPGAAYRAGKFVRRHRFAVASAAVLMLMLVAFAAVSVWQARRIARERDRANLEAATARQVSTFLVNLFRVSDPSEARGRTVTAREILDKGAAELPKLADQPDVQTRLQATIGSVYTNLGAYSAAIPLLEQALSTQRARNGSDHPDTISTINDLAALNWYQNLLPEAESLYAEVVDRRTRLLGAEHVETLRAKYELASVFARQRNFPLAERLNRELLAVQSRVLGADHLDTIATQGNLAAVLNAAGRNAEAAAILENVLEARRRLLGPDHPLTITALGNLAFSYYRLGDYPRAEQTYAQSIDLSRRVNGDLHQRTAIQRGNLGRMFTIQKRFAEAEPVALKAYEGFATSLGPTSPSAIEQMQLLVEIYELSGKPQPAAQWQEKLNALPKSAAK